VEVWAAARPTFDDERFGRLKREQSSLQLLDLARDVSPIQEATDLRDLFAALAHSVLKTINADGVLVSLVDHSRDLIVDIAASVVPPYRLNTVAEEYPLSRYPATRRVIETGRALEVSISDPTADGNERKLLAEMGAARLLLSRLTVEGRGIGTVEAYRVNDRAFRKDDPRQVELLVSFAANAYSRIKLAERLEAHYTETIEALMSALEARDPATQAHTGRIRDLSLSLAATLQLSAEGRRAIRLGAILHDVGKIGIPDAILRKPGPLSQEEWAMMRLHPEIGARMLQGIDFLSGSLPIIRHHHERWDGSGYPDQLAGEDIPIGARIVAVCDAFDAMTSDRPYRSAMSIEEASAEIRGCAGTHFDPLCAEMLVEIIDKMTLGENMEQRLVRFAG
jgi:HD-GYP domain-containing protein (c-di-GMP phosphodiesterase class II)